MQCPPEEQGRCRTCAFLAIKSSVFQTGDHLWECAQERRQDGNVYHFGGSNNRENAEPVCIRRVFEMVAEIGDDFKYRGSDDSSRAKNAALTVFGKDRGCKEWREYQPGIGPVKALEFSMFEQLEIKLEENRRAWEGTMESDRRKFEKELRRSLEDDRRKWQEDRDADNQANEIAQNKRDRRLNTTLFVYGAILTIVVAIVQAIFAGN